MRLSKIELIALIIALFVGLHFYNKHKFESEIEYGSEIAPVIVTKEGETPVIVAFGDSLTAGVGVPKDQNYPAQLSTMLGIDVINAGVSGERSPDAARRIGSVLSRYKPDIVLIEIGFDDLRTGRKRTMIADNLAKIVDRVKKAGATPVVIGVPDLDLVELMISSDIDLYEKVARAHGARYISDVFGPVLRDEDLKSDFSRPNAKGYRKAAQTIYHSLQGMLL